MKSRRREDKKKRIRRSRKEYKRRISRGRED